MAPVTEAVAAPPSRAPTRRAVPIVRAVLMALVVLGALTLHSRFAAAPVQEPLDLDINLVAAERLADGEPLYDDDAESRERAIEIGGRAMAGAFTQPTNSFVGPPSTALVHLPFTWFPHDTGVFLFRLLALAGMIASVGLVARCVAEGWRIEAFLVGTGILLFASATFETLQLGQGHELVMLGLSLAIWGTKRERWGWVGVGIGLATVLKISPVLLLVYLVLRGRRQVLPGFLAASVGLSAAAAAVGRPFDLVVWVRDVAPEVSRGVVRTINQSLPALVTRLVAPASDLSSSAELGAVRLVAVPLAIALMALLWRARRSRPLDPLELGVLILVGLVAGPLTWMHYATWACLPIVLLVEPGRWRPGGARANASRLVGAALVVVLLATRVGHPTEQEVRADAALRLTTSPGLGAALVLLVLCATALDPRPSPRSVPDTGRRGSPLGRSTPAAPLG